MPELPELEVVKEVLQERVAGQRIDQVQIVPPGGPIVVRDVTGRGFEAALTGRVISGVKRRGKFIVIECGEPPSALFLAINPKLSGRLQLADATQKRIARTAVVFTLENGQQLRYIDPKQMGQLYVTENLGLVPEYATLGPEALDISFDEFRERIRRFRGEIKGVLTRGEFVAGIGNAYADEILWEAKLHPFRKRTTLTPDELKGLYEAMIKTLADAIERVRLLMGENIQEEPREFMAVHMKTGEPCPRCGAPISMIGANQRITNFCRRCQPGGLIKGM